MSRDYSPLRELAATANTVHLKSSTVFELLDELEALRAAAAKPAKLKRNDYPTVFEAVWEVYPERPGDSKKAAYKAWTARINLGATPAQMLEGAKAYAAYVKAMRIESHFVKQAATFFGPCEHYAADWTVPEATKKPAAGPAWWSTDATILAKGVELGLHPYAGEAMPSFKGRIQAALENGGVPPAPVRMAPPIVSQHPAPPIEQRGRKPEGLNLRDLVRRDPPPRAA